MSVSPEEQLIFSLIAAFAGAFFAYCFLRLADAMKSLYDRKVKHQLALVPT